MRGFQAPGTDLAVSGCQSETHLDCGQGNKVTHVGKAKEGSRDTYFMHATIVCHGVKQAIVPKGAAPSPAFTREVFAGTTLFTMILNFRRIPSLFWKS